MKRNTVSKRPRLSSLGLAGASAVVFHFAASASPYVGYVFALSTIVLIGLQPTMDLPIWPNRKRPESPVTFAVFWGLIGGLIVPGLVVRYKEKGIAGWLEFLSAP